MLWVAAQGGSLVPKSMANALAILDEHEDNLNTFLDKCGLDNNAREMFDIFFQRLYELEGQVIAF